jgi:Putative DNA-binding domain
VTRPLTRPETEAEAWAAEGARQLALLAALHAPGPPQALDARAWSAAGERAARGLVAYRANAQALAHRAMSAAFPRLERMLGEDAFPALAAAFWRAHPPTRGDIAEWGDALPGWIAAQPSLATWPWLPDAARLDWAVHQAERAADALPDMGSLALLGEHDPGRLGLLFMPGVALVDSAWPIVTVFDAHAEAVKAEALDAMRRALDAGEAQAALITRPAWRAKVLAVDRPTARFIAVLLAQGDLGSALAQAVPEGFDFAAWLPRAVQLGWLKGVVLRSD